MKARRFLTRGTAVALLSVTLCAISSSDAARVSKTLVPTDQKLAPAGQTVNFPARPLDLALSGNELAVKTSHGLLFVDVRTGKIDQTLALPERSGRLPQESRWKWSDRNRLERRRQARLVGRRIRRVALRSDWAGRALRLGSSDQTCGTVGKLHRSEEQAAGPVGSGRDRAERRRALRLCGLQPQ